MSTILKNLITIRVPPRNSLDSLGDVKKNFVVKGVVERYTPLHAYQGGGGGGDVVEQINKAGRNATPRSFSRLRILC